MAGWAAFAQIAEKGLDIASAKAGQARGFKYGLALQKDAQRFGERMSSTAYQRGVGDMRAAGLNPILMASRGMPQASTPSSGTSSGPGYSGSGQRSDIVGSLLKVATAKNVQADTVRKGAETLAIGEQANVSKARVRQLDAQTAALGGVSELGATAKELLKWIKQRTYKGDMDWASMRDQVMRDIGSAMNSAKATRNEILEALEELKEYMKLYYKEERWKTLPFTDKD